MLFVIAGSVSTIAMSRRSSARARAAGSLNGTRTVPSTVSAGNAALLDHDAPVLVELHQRLVEVAVVLAVEHQDPVAAGRDAGHADRLGVRVRRGARVLPLRQPEAAGELLGHDDRVLDREQELVAAGDPVAHGAHQRLRRVAAEHRHVGDVEVAVLVAVDVGEVGALALGDPQRQVVVAADHPGHRDAVGHDPPAALEERGRASGARRGTARPRRS